MRESTLFPDPDRCPTHDRLLPCLDCARLEGQANKARKMGIVQHSRDEELDAAKQDWLRRASGAIHKMASELADFTGDELTMRGYIENPPGEGKIVGPAMQRAARAGWIWNTHTTRPSTNPRHNAQPREVWLSLLFGGPRIVARCPHCDGLGYTAHPAEQTASG